MIPCISAVTTLPSNFESDIRGYSDGGCHTLEVWLTKLETHLEKHTIAETRALIADRGMKLHVASYQGGLLLTQGLSRTASFDHFKRRLEICQALGIGTLVIVTDFGVPATLDTLSRAVNSMKEAAKWAAGFQVRLALEFRGTDTFCSSLDTALAMIVQCDESNIGVCLDLFHYYKGPSKPEDLTALTNKNLAHVQVCDVAGVPRELMTDSDRILPGEGDFHCQPVMQHLKAIQYNGCVSVELMNPMVWKSKPHQVAEIGMAALARLLA